MLKTLILIGYLIINTYVHHITPNHNHCSVSEILIVIPQASRFQKEATRWITIIINISSSFKPQLKTTSNIWEPTIKTLMSKLWSSQKTSKQLSHHPSHQSRIKLTLWNPRQTRRIHQILRNLTLWSRLTGGIHHWMVDSLQKLVPCGLWKWDPLTKILWHLHQYITQMRHCYGPQELLQSHQYVSKCVY